MILIPESNRYGPHAVLSFIDKQDNLKSDVQDCKDPEKFLKIKKITILSNALVYAIEYVSKKTPGEINQKSNFRLVFTVFVSVILTLKLDIIKDENVELGLNEYLDFMSLFIQNPLPRKEPLDLLDEGFFAFSNQIRIDERVKQPKNNIIHVTRAFTYDRNYFVSSKILKEEIHPFVFSKTTKETHRQGMRKKAISRLCNDNLLPNDIRPEELGEYLKINPNEIPLIFQSLGKIKPFSKYSKLEILKILEENSYEKTSSKYYDLLNILKLLREQKTKSYSFFGNKQEILHFDQFLKKGNFELVFNQDDETSSANICGAFYSRYSLLPRKNKIPILTGISQLCMCDSSQNYVLDVASDPIDFFDQMDRLFELKNQKLDKLIKDSDSQKLFHVSLFEYLQSRRAFRIENKKNITIIEAYYPKYAEKTVSGVATQQDLRTVFDYIEKNINSITDNDEIYYYKGLQNRGRGI